MPLFVREGAIIPMISTNVLSLCDAAYVGNSGIVTWDGSLQFLVYPATNSSVTVYDGTCLHCQTTGSDLTLSLSSEPRLVTLKILSHEPSRVERDGVTLARFAGTAGPTGAEPGWQYVAPFVLVKFKGTGGSDRIVIRDINSTR
jgi:hypothetical protein